MYLPTENLRNHTSSIMLFSQDFAIDKDHYGFLWLVSSLQQLI